MAPTDGAQIEMNTPHRAETASARAPRPGPATILLRTHLALLLITLCAGIGSSDYPPTVRSLAGLTAAGTLLAAPYWFLRSNRSLTLALAAAVVACLATWTGLAFAQGEVSSLISVSLLSALQLLLLVWLLPLLAMGVRPQWAEALAYLLTVALAAVVAAVIFLFCSDTPAHYLIGSGVFDQDAHFHISPYARQVQFFPSNPRGYFIDLGQERPAHWWAWKLAANPPTGGRGVMTITDSGAQRVRLEMIPLSPESRPEFTWNCNHWRFRTGQAHSIQFRARAERPQHVHLKLYTREPSPAGQFQREWRFEREWSDFKCELASHEIAKDCTLAFEFSEPAGTVEMESFRIEGPEGPLTCGAPLMRYMVDYQANDMGFRDRDYPLTRPEDTFRIVCLGDSYTWGQGVHVEDTYVKVLERILNDGPPRKQTYEVISCGRSGYNTGNERICFEREAVRYQPQLVVLQVCVNDFDGRPTQRLVYPECDLPPDAGDDQRCANEVRKLKLRCDQAGIKLVVLLFRDSAFSASWRAFQRTLGQVVNLKELPTLDIGRAWFAHQQGRGMTVHRTEAHPNEVAHRIAAEELARFLRSQGLLPNAEVAGKN